MNIPPRTLKTWLTRHDTHGHPSHIVQGIILGVLLLGVVIYQVLYLLLEEVPGPFSSAFFHALTVGTYGWMFFFFHTLFHERKSGPVRIFWVSFLHGILTLGLIALLVIGRPPRIHPVTYFPLDVVSALQVHLVAVLLVAFAYATLFRFRTLVFFKRTGTTLRNWYAMLLAMAMAALAMWGSAPQEGLNLPAIILSIGAIGMMIPSAFRLSWVVYLSFREKLIAIAVITLFLLLDLSILIGIPGLPDLFDLVEVVSYPVGLFALFCLSFAAIYATTSLLSLLFHLPTTGDFQRKMEELAALHALSRLVAQVFDYEQLVTTIVQSPVESGIASAAWLVLIKQREPRLQVHIAKTHGLSPSAIIQQVAVDALVREAIERRKPLVLEDAPTDPRIRHVDPGSPIRSLAVVPLIARNEPLGALFVARKMAFGFEDDDLEALSAFADQAALALDNARLFREQLEKERLARELAIAREIQLKLLPRHLPRVPGLSLKAASIPAAEVGGDYFDARKIGDHALAFVVADVAGKGTSAAFYMAEMRGIFHALAPLKPEPEAFICDAHRALSSSLERNVFISLVYGLVDTRTETLHLARAGHCPPALVRLSGEARYLQTPGLAIGLERTERYCTFLRATSVHLQPGDVAVCFTDGLVESRNAAGEEYGYDRLLARIQALRYADAEDIYTGILEDLHGFLGDRPYSDDLTLFVLKWYGVSTGAYAGESLSSST